MNEHTNIVKFPWRHNPCSPESFYSSKKFEETKCSSDNKINENKDTIFINLKSKKSVTPPQKNKSDQYSDEYSDIFKDL